MSAGQRQIRNSTTNLESHFEKSLQELNAPKKGTIGRSADVQELIADEEGSDALKETFILRKTSLTQEQWDLYLSTDTSRPGKEDIHESTALLSRKSNISQGSFTGDGAVSSRKNTSFDVETGASVSKGQARSIFYLPLTSPWNPFVMIWTQVVLLLDLTYTAFLLPIIVGFQVPDVGWGYGCIIDFIAGLLYTIEFFVNFNVGFIGKNNTRRRLIMDGKAIAWFYVTRGHFFVDFLTVAVFIAQIVFIILYDSGSTSLSDSVATKVYQAVRVIRLVRFTSLLRRLYATAAVAQSSLLPGVHVSNATASFFNICFGGLVLVNFLNCVWNFTAIAEGFDGTWVNLYSVFIRIYGSADSQTNGELTSDEARGIPGPHRYLVGMYYILVTVGTVGYGDIYPQTVAEEFIGMFIILLGLVFFGIILASLAEALQRLSQDAKQAVIFRGRMESVEKWMTQRRLPQRLRNRIANYYAEDWLYGADAGEEVQVMTELPFGLRKEIALAINVPLFKKLSFFHTFPDQVLATIASHMSPLQLPAGFEICEEGDIADCFYILHDGEVSAYSFVSSGVDMQLKAPALLGQVALLQEQDAQYMQRQCGYRTHTSCLLWEIPLREILAVLRQYPQLYAMASQQALPNHYFDYLAINPSATFLAEQAQAQDKMRDKASYKELDEEKTLASQGGPQLSMRSNPSMRGSQNVTRSELKKSQLLSAKSMGR